MSAEYKRQSYFLFFQVCILVVALVCSASANAISEKQFSNEILRIMGINSAADRVIKLREMLIGASNYERFIVINYLIKDEIRLNKIESAEKLAKELLILSGDYVDDWNYGNAIHDSNMVLGIVALKTGDIEKAKKYLSTAGKTPGSPQIKNFGPNLMLAKELLEKGEAECVISYLNNIQEKWIKNNGIVKTWIAQIQEGEIPDFGVNLKF